MVWPICSHTEFHIVSVLFSYMWKVCLHLTFHYMTKIFVFQSSSTTIYLQGSYHKGITFVLSRHGKVKENDIQKVLEMSWKCIYRLIIFIYLMSSLSVGSFSYLSRYNNTNNTFHDYISPNSLVMALAS